MGGGRQRRGASPPRSSSQSPFSLVASPFESIRLPPSVRLISVFFHRTPTPPEIVFPLSFSLSFSLPLLLFLTFNSALSGSDLYLFVTTARTSPLDFRKICIRVSLIMRGELASEEAKLSAPISRLLRGAE